jgi:hypothetical protein
MANAPFKLRSGNRTSFKAMGSSPAKHPLDREHTHPKEEKEKGPVKGPEETDVMDIIRKRKQSGPQNSEENKQKEIDKLVEERDPTAGKGKSVAKPKIDWTETEAKEKEADKKKKEEEDKRKKQKETETKENEETGEVKQNEDKDGNKIKRDADGKKKGWKEKTKEWLKEKGTDFLNDLSDKQKESSSEKSNRRRKKREEFLKKERERLLGGLSEKIN